MQKISKLFGFVMAIGAVTWLSSCDPTVVPTPGDPTISVTDDQGNTVTEITGIPGDQVTLTASGTTEAGFNVLRITVYNGTTAIGDPTEVLTGDSGDTTYSIDFTYTFEEAYVDEPIVIEFQIVDDSEDGLGTAVIDIDVYTNEPPNPVTAYTATLLQAPTQDNSNANWFASENGNTYSNNDVTQTADPVSITIDFGYYYGNSDLASFASTFSNA